MGVCDDLISRQAAIDALLHNQEGYFKNFPDVPMAKYAVALIDNDAQTIAQLPPITDVVEVVRCKDCVFLEILNGDTYYARCNWHGRLFDSFGRVDTRTWFCADGKRREDVEETD